MQLQPAARFKVIYSGVYRWAFIKLNLAQREETRMVLSLMSIPILQILLLVDIACARYWGGPLREQLEGLFLSTCHLLASHVPVSKGETDGR